MDSMNSIQPGLLSQLNEIVADRLPQWLGQGSTLLDPEGVVEQRRFSIFMRYSACRPSGTAVAILVLKLLVKAILPLLMTVGLSAAGCQSDISEPLPAIPTSLPVYESIPSTAATAPTITSATVPLVTKADLTVTAKVLKESTQEESIEPPTLTALADTNSPAPSPPLTDPIYYVSPDGDDSTSTGSVDQPWATIGHAVKSVEDGATIIVRPGAYTGQLSLKRGFSQGVIVQSEEPYQAQLRHNETVVACYYCQGIILSGFDIAHTGEGAGRYVIQIQDLSDDQSGGRRVTLRNNIIHDSRNNDLIKVNNGADDIIIEGNMFYNMGGPGLDSFIDVNSVTNVIIQDNVFFNDFSASWLQNNNDTGSFIVIKDSNGDQDANLGSKSITVKRNVFLNWQGDEGNTFLVIGEDHVPYFQADGVLVENNLMLGNAENPIRAAFHVRGSRNVIFRNNTVSGDLPGRSYAMRLSRAVENQANEDIHFYNNIWSDPTGTMGMSEESDNVLFAQAKPADTKSVELLNNLYWNGGEPIPRDENQLVNYTDDTQRVLADPELADVKDIDTPYWLAAEGRFADGSMTIEDAFRRLVMAYGATAASSPTIDAAAIKFAAEEDILGNPRSMPDIGAYEYPGPP